MKIRKLIKEEYRKSTASDWFGLSLYAIIFYCGYKLSINLFVDHVILHAFLANYFAEKGKIELANVIGANIKLWGWYVIGFVISLLMYSIINTKKIFKWVKK